MSSSSEPAEEPSLPARPVKPGSEKSPASHSWYHANLDRKRAEAMLRKYSKVNNAVVVVVVVVEMERTRK